ncbi:MAG: hypothetical protein GY805_12255, partial [Chloroflexi bacterium]|nr:hypothetical protein [Chloroflexota bacterium]
MTRQPQSREQMADLLWDATSTSQSLKNLRTLLWRMRKWMPDLKVTRKQVTYRGETAVSTDLQTVINALASDNPQNINEALRLYEGDLLSGFYLNDAPRFNEWLLLEREQLRQRVITAYRQLCSVYVKQSDWSQGIDVAQRWLQLDPFDEEALRELMQMLAADGETSSALKQYNHSKLHLWDEFAVEPEQATQALAEQLSQLLETGESDRLSNVVGNTQIIWPEKDELAEPGLLPSLSTIPYQRNNDFVGRRELLLHLAEQLLPWPDAEDSANRTVAITGMGGVGKTQLAVEFCYRYGRYFPGGVFWLNFADAENIVEEIVAIGGERGMGLYKDTDKLSQADQIGRIRKAWQESIPRLLVFDNCEEEVLLSEWVPVTGGCRVLLTSRRASWSRELQVRERPLSLLEKPESIALLKQLAPNLNQKEAAKIANELGHLPLAIHLAGSFLNRYPQITGKQYIKQLHKHDILDHPSLHGRGTTYSPTNHELNIFRTFGLNLEWIDTNHETNAMARHLLMCAAQFAPGEPIPRDLLLATSGHEDDMLTLLLAEDALSRLITLGFIHAKGKETITMHRLLLFFTNIVLSDNRTAQQAVEDAVWHKVRDIWERETYLGILPIAATHL